MSIRILRVQFRNPVSGLGREFASISTKDDHITVKQVGGGVNLHAEGKPITYVPDSNIVSITFEPEGKLAK